ncbi:hypothetical protein B0H63DRAFT_512765 [Podospora didyma]|uniref:histidine kinase n=1 Tax=Podospora didyma TaxID=330526 RepID=A0AAE0KDL7_9PEZI|nr:hypothetical protein B0H63DRAFT_512765 [Podospora didyma]
MIADSVAPVGEGAIDEIQVPPPTTTAALEMEEEVETYERARQREIAAYLSACSFPPGLPTGPEPAPEPILNPDVTLNALVQLGALRLDCKRSFLSLIDREFQYVASEMTRSHRLRQVEYDPDDQIWLGVSKLEYCWGVCPTTMKAFMDETGAWIRQGPNIIANRTRFIINDFRTDDAYKNRPYVTGYPFFVSYLEVPLISPLGYVLGSYCVVDDKVRDYDNDYTVGIMNEIADAIMVHLDHVRMKQSRHRSEQLIQGLSGFIGYEPTSTPHLQRNSSRGSGESVHSTATEQPSDMREPAPPDDDPNSNSSSSGPGSGIDNSDNSSAEYSQSLPLPHQQSASSIETGLTAETGDSSSSGMGGQNTDETPPTTPRDEIDDPMEQHILAGDQVEDANDPTPPSPTSSGSDGAERHANGFISSANIKSTFFRAAGTIRRAMNMDGLMFLDAAPTAFANRSDQPALEASGASTQDETAGPFCATIVQSVVDQTGEAPLTHSSHTRLPEATLQRFIRRFPRGHVFSADEHGPIDESYAPGKQFPGGSQFTPQSESLIFSNDVATLFRVLPAGAKYVIFLPLWHFQRECWYAATLGWVSDSTRAIDVADINLVSAFGNSVMAEVSRLEALAASRAKSNFVSSISHELRSPLHGIMASSELLREGITDPSLLSALDMLDSCGTTLLDTFNNLLDHAIVTNAGKGATTPPVNDLADLGGLVEDVVEAVKFSHLSENAFHSSVHRKGVYSSELAHPDKPAADRVLLVALNIEKRTSWKLPLDIGAWKRIVINIFGNALKYTSSGRIEVGLKVVQKLDKMGKPCDYVSFSVEDTGWGMSSDYLKYQLFTPFSQENSHSPGMGLGLSIVQQLASSLGGTVDVKSSVGIGTRVEVLAPLSPDIPDAVLAARPTIAHEHQSYYDHLHQLHGRTACLITPEAYAALSNMDLVVTPEMRHRSAIVERAFKINGGETLGMKVILASSDCPAPTADFYFLDGTIMSEAANGGLGNLVPAQYSQVMPLVLLCSRPGSPSCLKQQELLKGYGIHLHDPVGPRKLASMLVLALKAELDSRPSDDSRPLYHAVPPQPVPMLTLPSHLKKEDADAAVEHKKADAFVQHQIEAKQPPPEPQPSSEKATPPVPPDVQQPSTRHLLLVDDNPINIKLLTTVMRKLNHTFVTACHGLEAVNHFKDSLERGPAFDLVFMDISMPVMDGFEATRQIRQLEIDAGVKRCKVIALTGLSSELSRKEAFSSGSDQFLTKPVKLDKVKKLLAEEFEEAKDGDS